MKRNIVWLAVSCSLVVALLLAACAPAVPKEKEVAPTPKETIKPVVELPRVSSGATMQGTGVAVTISEISVTDSYQYSRPISGQTGTETASPDTSFLIATVEIKNVSTTTQNVGGFYMRAFDSEGFEYKTLFYTVEAPLQFGPLPQLEYDRALQPGDEIKQGAVFEIRKGASGLGIRYTGLAVWEVK